MTNGTQAPAQYRLICVADRELIQFSEYPTYRAAFDAMLLRLKLALIESGMTSRKTWKAAEPDILQQIKNAGSYEESDFGISTTGAWYNGPKHWDRYSQWDWYIVQNGKA